MEVDLPFSNMETPELYLELPDFEKFLEVNLSSPT